jgi:hypothetical protein
VSDRQKRKARRLRQKQEALKRVMAALLEYHPSTRGKVMDYGHQLNMGNLLYYQGLPVTIRFELRTEMMNKRVTEEQLLAVGKRFIDNALAQCDPYIAECPSCGRANCPAGCTRERA